MHREKPLKATLWSGCLYVLGLVLYSTTLLAAETGDADPPSVDAKTDKEAVTLPEMTVTAAPGRDTGYRVPNATTATKTDTPIMETPVNIQVVPRQVLKDQQVTRINQALRNVSGVYTRPSNDSGFGTQDLFNIRGFDQSVVYRDGFRFESISGGPSETANLERIEVLKGPALTYPHNYYWYINE